LLRKILKKMSQSKFELKSFSFKDDFSTKKQLNEIWKKFMISFGYQKYYNFQKDINSKLKNNLYNSTINTFSNNSSFILSVKSFFQFLEQNSITISEKDNYITLISNSKKGLCLLSEVKIWIMYILFIDQKYDESNYNLNKISIIMNLFKESVKYNCDIISLFEFFLIYISKIDQDEFSFAKSMKIIDKIPKEFIVLYKKNKHLLKNIFCKNKFSRSCNSSNLNYFKQNNLETQSTIFSTNKNNENEYIFPVVKNEEFKIDDDKNKNDNENENKNINLDMDKILIICKDYLNKGYFAIFQEKKSLEENDDNIIKNPFIENDNYIGENDEENFCLMPLLSKYDNYSQKMEADKILNLINKSIYKNYTYYPYDISIVSKL